MLQWTSIELIGLAWAGIAALAVLVWLVWAGKRLAAETGHARKPSATTIDEVQAAAAISAARPGARPGGFESCVTRSRRVPIVSRECPRPPRFTPVEKFAAVCRVSRCPPRTPSGSPRTSRGMENARQYPGQDQVTVLRDTRAVEIAR